MITLTPWNRSGRVARPSWHVLALFVVLALIVAACADGDEDVAVADLPTEEEADAVGEADEAPEGEAAEEPDEVLSAAFINNASAPLVGLTAAELGYFEDVGLDVEFAQLETGTEAIAAMIGGSADFVTAADARVIQAIDQDLPIVVVGIHNSGFLGSLSVRADNDEVEDMSDLVGQRVGVQVGSGVHTAWLRYLAEVGLDPEDFEVTNLAVADMPAALEGGSIDAGLMWHPHAARGEIEGLTRLVMPANEFAEPIDMVYPFYLITTQDMVNDNPEVVRRFTHAWTCAQNWIGENPSEAVDILATAFEGLEREVVQAIFDERAYDRFQVFDDVVMADTTSQAEQLVANGDLAGVPDLEGAMDDSFVREAVAQGC